jgi:hypothetical protein
MPFLPKIPVYSVDGKVSCGLGKQLLKKNRWGDIIYAVKPKPSFGLSLLKKAAKITVQLS